jgi:hypothetical protein
MGLKATGVDMAMDGADYIGGRGEVEPRIQRSGESADPKRGGHRVSEALQRRL